MKRKDQFIRAGENNNYDTYLCLYLLACNFIITSCLLYYLQRLTLFI